MEVSAVSLLLLVPLIYTERLGLGWIQSNVLHPPPPPPPPVKRVVDVQIRSRTTGHVWRGLTVPMHVPVTISTSQDDPPPVACCADPIPGVYSALAIDGPILPPPLPKPQPKPVEAKKPIEPASLIKVSQGTQEAKIIRRVIPVYPALARQARVQGTVKLLGVISIDGRIEKLQVLSGHPLLVQAAVEAVKQWTYRPTLLNGQPVEVQAPIEVNFILSN